MSRILTGSGRACDSDGLSADVPATGGTDEPTPRRRYALRRDRFGARGTELEELSRRLGRLRVAAFVTAVGAAGAASEFVASPWSALLLVMGLGAVAGFLYLVARHRRTRELRREAAALQEVNVQALARLDREWERLPPSSTVGAGLKGHPNAGDLDIVGEVSLERLLSTVATGPGARTLRRWLLHPAPPEEVRRRQEAIGRLAPRLEPRQRLAARARCAELSPVDDVEAFLEWAESRPWLSRRPWLLWTARLLPAVTLALVVADVAGMTSLPWWGLSIAAGLTVARYHSASVASILRAVSDREAPMGSYAPVLQHLEDEVLAPAATRDCPLLRELRLRLGEGRRQASTAVRRLERLLPMVEIRFNEMLHFLLQALFLWDVHVLWLVERWQDAVGRHARRWLDVLGEVEALCALAVLRGDHPEWSFPVLSERDDVRGRDLGHPLLRPAECVGNDVEVGPPGTFLLVTGSNMSGKSTLLRALGVNAVLARAGAPVCARFLELPPVSVYTSMRVEDSLAEGVSTFLAELRRVAAVVEAARACDSRAPVLYLLDEPLQGTNEVERREALRIVLGHLVETEAVGAVATHDLEVHRTDRLEPAARTVHFTGTVLETDGGEGRLEFDYRLRSGVATTTNALDLLRMAGLGEGGRT